MVGAYEGTLSAAGIRFGIVTSRFNSLITKQLLEGAKDAVRQHGGSEDSLIIVHVPGSMEIPLAAKELALSGRVDTVLALGAIIRGETDHYDHVATQTAAGISQVSLETGIPVIFGVLTTENVQQALERSGVKSGNKGFESACAGMEMVNLLKQLRGASSKKSKITAV